MNNIAEFRIIGRIGKINKTDNAVYIDTASNYGRKVNGQWEDDTHWNTVRFCGKLKDRAAQLNTGDLIHVTGKMRQTSFERDGETQYGFDLFATSLGTIVKNEQDGNDA